MGDIEGTTSQDAPRRAFQNRDGDTLQLFLLPSGVPVHQSLDANADPPGAERERRCARVFGECAIFVTRWKVAIFEETGLIAMVIVVARTANVSSPA